jgi:hypothetical protein
MLPMKIFEGIKSMGHTSHVDRSQFSNRKKLTGIIRSAHSQAVLEHEDSVAIELAAILDSMTAEQLIASSRSQSSVDQFT